MLALLYFPPVSTAPEYFDTHRGAAMGMILAGAGIGGLTLAQVLRKNSIPFTIFDRDADATSRPQGWAIGLHTMLEDLRAYVDPAMLPSLAGVDHLLPLDLPSQFAIYTAKDPSRRFGVQDDGSGAIVRANRRRLKEWLGTGLDVRYGKTAVAIVEGEDGVVVEFVSMELAQEERQ